MTDDRKSDIQRAQAILHRALVKVAKLPKIRHDPALFVTLVMVAYSAVVAESASDAKVMEPGGIEAMIKFAQDELGKIMREDFAGRKAHDAAQPRH
jgi:hypothetical protein